MASAVSGGQSLTATGPEYSNWDYQTIALAAVAQAAALVHRFAAQGEAPQAELVSSINTLFVMNPDSTADVYPRIGDFNLGLRTLQDMFSAERTRQQGEIVRYTLGLLTLRGRLMKDLEMMDRIGQRLPDIEPLEAIPANCEDAELVERLESAQERSFRQLAALYQDTISTLPYRIQVQGRMDYLKDEAIANRIRAVLLAGIRSAILWQQLGGRRWRLLLHRKNIHETAGNIRRKSLSIL